MRITTRRDATFEKMQQETNRAEWLDTVQMPSCTGAGAHDADEATLDAVVTRRLEREPHLHSRPALYGNTRIHVNKETMLPAPADHAASSDTFAMSGRARDMRRPHIRLGM